MTSPLLAYYGDDFTGSADVMEVLTWAGLRTVLFLEPPTHTAVSSIRRLACIWNRRLEPQHVTSRDGYGIETGPGTSEIIRGCDHSLQDLLDIRFVTRNRQYRTCARTGARGLRGERLFRS